LDDLTIALVLCIGSGVAWLLALYTERGFYRLLWNVPLGIAGAALCALTLSWTGPLTQAVGLFTVAPLSAVLMIFAGHAVRRALLTRPPASRDEPG
jgi:hypothetical protein